MTLRILCLNVRYCQGQDGPNHWPARLPHVVNVVERTQPDLIALQEVLPHQRLDLERAFPDFGWFGQGRQRDFSGEQCPVGVKSTFEVLSSSNIWLSECPDRPGSVGWDACLPRICTTVVLRVNEQKVVFASIHLDHLGHKARVESVKLVCSILNEPRTIVAGDFNCGPGSTPVEKMCERFAEGHRALGARGPLTTFHDFHRLQGGPQIDYIFCDTDFEFNRFEVLREDGAELCSDHYPLLATLKPANEKPSRRVVSPGPITPNEDPDRSA